MRKILGTISKIWPKSTKVKFILTCGAFLRFKWPESIKKEDIGDNKNPNKKIVDILVAEAEKYIRYVLKDGIREQLSEYADYITIGIDSFSKDPATHNYTSYPHIELVFLVDLNNDEYYWTGKSYPTLGQERGLVRISDLNKHIFDLKVGKTLIFCCYDLNIYNPRSITAKGWREEINRKFKELVTNENPSIALHHPHSTIKSRTWLNPWKNLIKVSPSIVEYAGNGMYFETGKQPEDLNKVLEKTKMGNSIDFIVK